MDGVVASLWNEAEEDETAKDVAEGALHESAVDRTRGTPNPR
jgi:hypothetical protein